MLESTQFTVLILHNYNNAALAKTFRAIVKN